jgi:hypothetical protein
MSPNPEPDPQSPSLHGITDERELDWLLSLATTLQAQQRYLQKESRSEVTAGHHPSEPGRSVKNS